MKLSSPHKERSIVNSSVFVYIFFQFWLCYLLGKVYLYFETRRSKVQCLVSVRRVEKMAEIANLPSFYEYYSAGGVTSGLSADQPYFTLNNRNVTIMSGAMHYFRIPKEYWRDRLRKLRAAGLNTVETYVPWNLHEPEEGVFDFGYGGSDMQELLDIQRFLEMAKEEDLFAIVRPGPYICSEWEFGGLPSWLLRIKNIKVRTSESNFMQKVTNYFNVLLPILAMLQFTRGGSIIALQIENEYGSTYQKNKFLPDKVYLEELRQLMARNGLVELLFTSDSPTMSGTLGSLPGVLQTANFADNPAKEFDRLKQLQRDKPSMAMEFWTGWFDHWSEFHQTQHNATDFRRILDEIFSYPGSVNMYMFIGGTSWGFMNGANIGDGSLDNHGFQPDTTSYDYDAPLTEAGDYTMKYVYAKELLHEVNPVKTRTPETPAVTLRKVYPNINTALELSFSEIIKKAPHKIKSRHPIPMEFLPINNNNGQSYGYIVYRKENMHIKANSTLLIKGRVCDTVMVLINGVLMSKPLKQISDFDGFGYWRLKDSTLNLGMTNLTDATLELVVENWGRNNFGNLDQFLQFKGIWQGGIYINNLEVLNWDIVPLEFKKRWTNSLEGWHSPVNDWMPGPSLFKFTLETDNPQDTYLDMTSWTKGIVIVNGFVLGRYAAIGPQQTLYLPAPFLKVGSNDIVIFEHFYPAKVASFVKNPIFRTNTRVK